jgi:hypothetical protein
LDSATIADTASAQRMRSRSRERALARPGAVSQSTKNGWLIEAVCATLPVLRHG